MKLDMYSLKGRIAPAFLTIILPIVVFNYFFASDELSKLFDEIMAVKVISNITVPLIFLFFLSQLGRVVGKNVFEKMYFKEEKLMPTTSFLLFSDSTYSEEHKTKIRNKISSDFSTVLPTKDEEELDTDNARIRIVELMALVRAKLSDNKFLLQHNIEYGAMRNAIGGSVFGVIFSVANIIIFKFFVENDLAVYISIALLIFYVLLILFSKVLLGFYGRSYAKILFREYMLLNDFVVVN